MGFRISNVGLIYSLLIFSFLMFFQNCSSTILSNPSPGAITDASTANATSAANTTSDTTSTSTSTTSTCTDSLCTQNNNSAGGSNASVSGIFKYTDLKIDGILDHQIFQRDANNIAALTVPILLSSETTQYKTIIRDYASQNIIQQSNLVTISNQTNTNLTANVTVSIAAAGGFYILEIWQLDSQENKIRRSVSSPFAVGDVFLTAGQSSNANYGEAQTKSVGLVYAFDAAQKTWAIAADPQPGASGWCQQTTATGDCANIDFKVSNTNTASGSVWPSFGDALYHQTQVPVGLVATAYAGTYIAQWLQNSTEPQPTGQTSGLFSRLTQAVQKISTVQTCPIRAVLWGQGETDAFKGTLTQDYITAFNNLKSQFQQQTGCQVPWIVARNTFLPLSYFNNNSTTQTTNEQNILNAQKSLANSSTIFQGPLLDGLLGTNRSSTDLLHWSSLGVKTAGEQWTYSVLEQLGIVSKQAYFSAPSGAVGLLSSTYLSATCAFQVPNGVASFILNYVDSTGKNVLSQSVPTVNISSKGNCAYIVPLSAMPPNANLKPSYPIHGTLDWKINGVQMQQQAFTLTGP